MNREQKFIFAGLISFALVILLRNAWLSDDAFITLRTVDNFVNGYGLRWNVAERVQSFTSPLWTLALIPIYAITKEPVFSTSFVMVACALMATIAALPIKSTIAAAVLVFAVALSSPTFIFYSVSGLENPLAFLLIGLFFKEYLGQARLTRIGFLFSLLVLTRHDLSIIAIFPLLETLARQSQKGDWLRSLPSFLPIIIWEIFSLIYYGSLVPNTGPAKLPLDYPQSLFFAKGIEYYLDAFSREPLTIIIILLGIGTSFTQHSRKFYFSALSIVLYLGYILLIGGDFMSGRFFGPPMWIALVLIAHTINTMGHRISYSLASLAIGLGLLAQHPVLLENASSCCGKFKPGGMADEKQFYYQGSGLLNWDITSSWPNFNFATPGRALSKQEGQVVSFHSIGMVGYYAGPKHHIIDRYGLGDAFLSRLVPIYANFRPGHYERLIPAGYSESLRENKNILQNAAIKPLLDDIMLITRGEIFSKERFRAILDVTFGAYKPLVRTYSKSLGIKVPAKMTTTPKTNGTPWNAEGNIIIPLTGLTVEFKKICSAKKIDFSLDHNDLFIIRLSARGVPREDFIIHPVRDLSGLINHSINIHAEFDEISIYNISADPLSSLGHLTTEPTCE
jgi:arabinofuranosyltransferase